MPRLIEDIEKDILIVTELRNAYIAGKRLTKVQIGSNDFLRAYTYAEITVEVFDAELAKLREELHSATVGGFYFRPAVIPMRVR